MELTATVTVHGLDEALKNSLEISRRILKLGLDLQRLQIQDVSTSKLTDGKPTEVFAAAVADRMREDVRHSILNALIDLAQVCAPHGWWEDANDVLLDASEQAFAATVKPVNGLCGGSSTKLAQEIQRILDTSREPSADAKRFSQELKQLLAARADRRN